MKLLGGDVEEFFDYRASFLQGGMEEDGRRGGRVGQVGEEIIFRDFLLLLPDLLPSL
ncbi:MAG: hypothetical protein NWR51_09420 [Akkermansiaceae bacterium]|nr:hypothetical protein [Akkermansiaceae bacterium]MDP4898041.1 hypothetical protein [Akkermansiaceae bacterium]